jgi:hypothetical protein
MNKQKKKLRKPKFRPSKRTENRFVIAFQRANSLFLDGIEHEILFNVVKERKNFWKKLYLKELQKDSEELQKKLNDLNEQNCRNNTILHNPA